MRPGDVVLLEGDLGAGKSELARALIRARAGREIEVPSPTFTLLQVYDLPGLEIGHADLYRLGEPGEVLELGLEDCWAGGALLVEWPGRAPGFWPAERLRVRLETVAGGDTGVRRAHLSASERWAGVLTSLAGGDSSR